MRSRSICCTRWITHICAPVFFLLTGTSAHLTFGRRTIPHLSRLLVTRGLWLIALELTIVRCFGYQFNVDYRVTLLVVLISSGTLPLHSRGRRFAYRSAALVLH